MRQSLSRSSQPSQTWPYWYLVPIYPYSQRQTLVREVVPDTIWVLEQVQGIFYVVVPIRTKVSARVSRWGERVMAGVEVVFSNTATLPELPLTPSRAGFRFPTGLRLLPFTNPCRNPPVPTELPRSSTAWPLDRRTVEL